MKIFARYFKGLAAPTIIAPLFKMLEATFELLLPLIVADIIDTGIPSGSLSYVAVRVGFMFLLAAIGWVCAVTAQFFSAKSAMGMAKGLRSDLLRHIQTFSFTEFDRLGTPTLVTRMTNDVTLMQNAVNLVLRVVLRCPFIIVGAIFMAFTISHSIALVFLAVTAVITLVLVLVLKGSMSRFVKAQTMLDRVTLKVRENIGGARVVRAFGGQAEEREEFEEANDAVRRFQIAAGRISAALNPVTFFCINLGIIIILLAGGKKVDAGVLTQGQVAALVNYMTQILLSFIRLTELVISISRGLAGARRVKAVLETETTMPDPANSLPQKDGGSLEISTAGGADVPAQAPAEVPAQTPADVPAHVPAVQLDHVSFTYAGASEPALKDIDLSVLSGETIGIIGGTGSGKTTLADLICRFYDATEGEVRIFGKEITSYGLKELPRVCGIVPQHSVLFAGTVRENMRTIDPEADDERIWQALGTAQAADFVEKLPGTLDSYVETGGSNFSGGQRQRLSIARALTARPPILVLDDSSSALDFATDAALRKALKDDLAGTTVFIISQRAATVRDADRIVVLDDGRMEAAGTHEELIKTSAVYKEICTSQGLIPDTEGVGA